MKKINTIYENAVYKTTDETELGMDFYIPAEINENMPAVMFFHGGYWKYGDKNELPAKKYGSIVPALNATGIIVASVDYRLVSEKTGLDGQLEDCADSLKWLLKNSRHFNIDVNRIALWGTSAGAHLAMMTAFGTTSARDFSGTLAGDCSGTLAGDFPCDSACRVKSVISFYGPTDLEELFMPDGAVSFERLKNGEEFFSYLNQLLKIDIRNGFELTSNTLRQLSPLKYLSPVSPKILLVHGDEDSVVPLHQSVKLKEFAGKTGVDAELFVCERIGHGFEGANMEDMEKVTEKTVNHLKNVFNIS